jgi:arabinofuranosyltransferase
VPAAIGLTALLVLLAVTIARTAWVGDDAYITFRTIDNLLHG